MLNTSIPKDQLPTQNRRKSPRVRPTLDDVVTVYGSYAAGERWPAIIVDQSATGFGLALPSSFSLEIGDSVRVTSKRGVVKAMIVSRKIRKGGVRLGLRNVR